VETEIEGTQRSGNKGVKHGGEGEKHSRQPPITCTEEELHQRGIVKEKTTGKTIIG